MKGYFEGKGLYKNPKKGITYYEGDFKKGKFNGEGSIKWTDCSKPAISQNFRKYKGNFVNGKPHGYGKI